MDTAQLKLKLDISTGDPIRPGPKRVDVPALLDTDEPITMRGFHITMVLAEKAVTAVERGYSQDPLARLRGHLPPRPTTRDRRPAAPRVHRTRSPSIEEPRLRPLSVVLANYTANEQRRWAAWRRKQYLDELLRERFSDVLDTVVRLVDSILDWDGASTWNPSQQTWG